MSCQEETPEEYVEKRKEFNVLEKCPVCGGSYIGTLEQGVEPFCWKCHRVFGWCTCPPLFKGEGPP